MSSVDIKKFTCWQSGETIKMEVTYEANFSESEVRLDIPFVPTLVVTPGADYTGQFNLGGPAQSRILAIRFRKDVYLTLPTIRPASTPITRTKTVEAAKGDFWTSSDYNLFDHSRAAIDARIHLDPEVCASRATTYTTPLTVRPTATETVTTLTDTTDDLKGTITARGEIGSGESKEKLFDNQTGTKWLDLSPQGSWVQYTYAAGISGRLTSYTLTSAGDAPERDPADWQLLGSNDGGATWSTVDSRAGITFNNRLQKLTFTLSGTPTYKAYRLNITKVLNPASANSVQLAEIELLGQQVTV